MWDQQTFRERVKILADERGKSVAEVLRDAGLSPNFLGANRSNGVSPTNILRIAQAIGCSSAELSGLQPTTERYATAIDRAYLDAALRAAAMAFDDLPKDRARLAHISSTVAQIYDVLTRRGVIPDDESLGWLAEGLKLRSVVTRSQDRSESPSDLSFEPQGHQRHSTAQIEASNGTTTAESKDDNFVLVRAGSKVQSFPAAPARRLEPNASMRGP